MSNSNFKPYETLSDCVLNKTKSQKHNLNFTKALFDKLTVVYQLALPDYVQ